MCPACIGTMALVVAGATSTGGLTALLVRKLRATTGAKRTGIIPAKGEQHGSSKSRLTS